MEKFNLNTWLEDKSRKIVTRDGKPARIICYDVKKGKQDDYNVPIIALVDRGEEIGEMSYYYSEDGRFLRNPNQTHNLDLFFADDEEKEELSEFEKALLAAFNCVAGKAVMTVSIASFQEDVNEWSKTLLDLARKEIEKENPYSGNQNQEWSEEDEKLYTSALWHIKNSCGNGGNDSGEYEVYNWLKSIKDRVQPKPKQEWGEEDEKMCSQVINEIEAIKSNSSTIFEKNIAQDKIDWLKSIKDRVHPKQELSEEDEHCIELLLPIIDSSSLIPKNRKKCKEFLKSLKPNHWKPSEEQMEALFEAKLASINNREYFLGLLYEDLKKL